ncbi:MAG: ABC transporter ATP-binding protein [Deltaproteobacteria bacterium]|nr:ABC transporter ATP-binding protein [Deltaproteobacteria bacterium]
MRQIVQSVFFFPSVTKFHVLILVGITLAAAFFEGFGVAMLFPILEFIEKGRDFAVLAEGSRMWSAIGGAFDLLALPKNLISLMGIVFVLLLVRQFFNYLKTTYGRRLTESILSDIRSTGFAYFSRADISFYDSRGVGELINVLTVDGVRTGNGIFSFFNLLAAGTTFVFYFVFLLVLSPGMTLFAMLIMGCVGIILKSRITRSGKIGREVSRYNEKISAAIIERLNGIRLLMLSSTEDKETGFIRGLSERIRQDSFHIAKIRAKMEFIVDPMVILAGLSILYFSVEIFHMSLAKTGIFVFVLIRLMPYTKDIFFSLQAMAGFSGSVTRVAAMLQEAQAAQSIQGGKRKKIGLRKGIRFEDVAFQYEPGDEMVLKDVDIFIPAGKMTALVGRSGAGKSTLVDLIPRLRVPVKGLIAIDDIPIEEFDISTLRRSIAFVSQEGFLFNDTIENNIRYCSPGASREEVLHASEMAYADPFIREFPKGYDTVVGERGIKISGGQRQRIILARALLQKAAIIILDEPTSSLDSESEQYIQRAMEEMRATKNITMIIIAHRLSTIKRADQIVVLDKGRVVECGNHSALMHEESWYADMVRMQAVGGH